MGPAAVPLAMIGSAIFSGITQQNQAKAAMANNKDQQQQAVNNARQNNQQAKDSENQYIKDHPAPGGGSVRPPTIQATAPPSQPGTDGKAPGLQMSAATKDMLGSMPMGDKAAVPPPAPGQRPVMSGMPSIPGRPTGQPPMNPRIAAMLQANGVSVPNGANVS